MNCEYCQSPVHIWFQCPKKPDGWKPARLARVPRVEAVIPQPVSKEVAHRPVTDLQKADTRSPARLAKKSTGAKARAVPNQHGSQVAQKVEQGDASVIARGSYVAGSIPALPVDTNSPQGSKGLADAGREVTLQRPVEDTAVQESSVTLGLHPANVTAKFDKKAWMKAYMKPYLRQYRQDVKSGKRVPKKREC